MQGEREELVKRVFPEIRRRCEERGVVWGEIDLRWGVTDEQKAEGAVLPICLAEIERTPPLLHRHARRALRLGARRDLGRAARPRGVAPRRRRALGDRARDPARRAQRPGDGRPRALLPARPRLGRDACPPTSAPPTSRTAPRAGAASPSSRSACAAAASRCATTPTRARSAPSCAPTCWPCSTASSPASGRRARREAARLDQRAHAEALLPATLDRRDDLLAIAVAADADGPGAVVTGSPGSGVSTALAAFAARPPRGAPRRSRGRAPRRRAARRGLGGGAARPPRRRAGRGARRARRPTTAATGFAPLLARAAASRRVLLVVDGLHLIESAGGGVAWLPLAAPRGRGRRGGHAPRRDGRLAAGARALARRPAALHGRAARGGGGDVPGRAPRRRSTAPCSTASARPTGSPARGSCASCSTSCASTATTSRSFPLLDSLLAPEDLDGLLDVVLDRLERDYELDRPGLVGETLGALAASRTGLSEAELLDLLGDGARQPLSQLQLGAGGLLPEIGGYAAARQRRPGAGGGAPLPAGRRADAPAPRRALRGRAHVAARARRAALAAARRARLRRPRAAARRHALHRGGARPRPEPAAAPLDEARGRRPRIAPPRPTRNSCATPPRARRRS